MPRIPWKSASLATVLYAYGMLIFNRVGKRHGDLFLAEVRRAGPSGIGK
ncbi:uncharacterized protein METZ01_LOCUS206305 [marine metagenome]|uniref:Uncharacterized protein n=1 Tax=marine metagenome TaxID=408172 RepID=A0A382EU22_9ZZZZ